MMVNLQLMQVLEKIIETASDSTPELDCIHTLPRSEL